MAQLLQHQDDKEEPVVTPMSDASSCDCSSVFWRRRALLSRILVCVRILRSRLLRVSRAAKTPRCRAKTTDVLSVKRWRWWDVYSPGNLRCCCGAAAAAAEQRRSLWEWNAAVRACMRACSGGNWCCEMDNSSSLFRPSRYDTIVMPPPPLEPKFAWNVYS